MKYNSFTFIFAVALMLTASIETANAQKVVLHMAGNKTFECSISELDSISFVDTEEHEWVDLGLPSGTLWATCNVGANSPEEYGDYFAWGETETKGSYEWSNYKYCNGSSNTMTKYCTISSYGSVDNKTELEAEDDAATVNLGDGWQMPSNAQIIELYDSNNTTTSWTTQNGVNGRLITSLKNGKTLFLPAAGNWDDTGLVNVGSNGDYLSRSLSTRYSKSAYSLTFDSNGIEWNYRSDRYIGRVVRPVRVP